MASDDDWLCGVSGIYDRLLLDFEIPVPNHYVGHDLTVLGKAVSGLASLSFRDAFGHPYLHIEKNNLY